MFFNKNKICRSSIGALAMVVIGLSITNFAIGKCFVRTTMECERRAHDARCDERSYIPQTGNVHACKMGRGDDGKRICLPDESNRGNLKGAGNCNHAINQAECEQTNLKEACIWIPEISEMPNVRVEPLPQ